LWEAARVKRDPALVSLSHDHHQALFVAQRLSRCTPENAAEARDALLSYWSDYGREHFHAEEEVLLPAFAAHGDPFDPLVARALCEHVAIRRDVAEIAARPDAGPQRLRALGEALAAHVRLEERELFPMIERALPADALASLAGELARDEARADG